MSKLSHLQLGDHVGGGSLAGILVRLKPHQIAALVPIAYGRAE